MPVVAIAVAATAAAALLALSTISRTLRARAEQRAVATSQVVSRGEFATNTAILRTIQEITGQEILTYSANGTVLASTSGAAVEAAAQTIISSDATRAVLAARTGAPATRDLACGTVDCFVIYRPVVGRTDVVVAVVAELSEVSSATAAFGRALLIALVVSVVAIAVVGQLVTRRLTAPLEQLVAFVRTVPDTDGRRAATGNDEVGRLGAAFNDMLDRLDASREALVRSEKLGLAGMLAARVAHDIRNPLSSMKMQTQMVQAGVRTPEERASLAAVLHDITTVEAVIRDLLELARPTDLNRRDVDLNAIVTTLLTHLTPQFTHRRISVHTRLEEALPPVRVDAERLSQALHNVAVNAADAMPAGGMLDVSTRRVDVDHVAIEVCDDGAGIDPAIAERIFDPFVSTKREGIGLGLVNVKTIVESHGGTITLVPRRPRGTCATITLPLRADI